MEIIVREIRHGSNEYEEEVELRIKILRDPLGLTLTKEQLETEVDEYHIAAFSDGKIVGCLLLKPMSVNEVQMRQVAVTVDSQNTGIGRKMVVYAEKFIADKGFGRIMLHAREVVVPFYEKLGYSAKGDVFIEVTIPHRTMVKSL